LVALARGTANGQELSSATFDSITGDDGKDHDTGVYVQVFDATDKILLAQAINADNCGNCEYRGGTKHSIHLQIVAKVDKASCADFVVTLFSKATGNDQWEIRVATVTLTFSDGSQLTKSVYNVVLNSRSSDIAGTRF
jgi:hypothetical protein